MARKKIEPIETLGADTDKLIVQKSKPLFALWRSELTLAEFKILDTYLARIDSHKPDKRTVVFEKGELEELLGVKKINVADLDERLAHLMTTIKIEDNNTKRGFVRIALFEKAAAEQDEYGLRQVQLECTHSAMKYVFNIDNIGYLRYKLRCITALKSRQAYILFMYLETNRFRTPFEVELEELKTILCCEKEKTYKEFKRFNDRVLKRIQKELNEKTECKFRYEPIKKGRSVVAIRFILETLPKLEADDNQMTIEEWQAGTDRELWQTPLEQFNFSKEQYDELFSVLITVPDSKLPQSSACYGSIELMRYHYIDQKAKELLRRDKEKPIRNKYIYILKMLKQDADE